ncbi:MAG: HEAT repeat domain-containing protein, partial [Isosphaeraceae bacterium]|nr:HEAT repeat domain-containing protein [Isosphaeraceae bacterium]
AFEAEPNNGPAEANPLTLGQPVYGLADDRPYLPLGESPTEAVQSAGVDWFRFTFESDAPRLAYFALDYVDRDVPPDVRVYQMKEGKPVEYTRGIDPQSLQRERPPRLGANKFTTRVLTSGTYYVMVDACQPEYQLRTKVFDVPPYLTKDDAADPVRVAEAARRAVRAAMDFELLAGDSWHANTPRKGHPMDRVANPHHETSTCIACHPTQFTTQSALTAVRYGYKVEQPFALEFLTDRLASNPVPFHGHSQALWARMIPAPANVMGRLSTILMDYEQLVDIHGTPRNSTHEGIAEFLKLYYDGRTALPPDESNGNNPVSRYKVATDSWRVLDEMSRRALNGQRFAETRDLVARLLPTGKPDHTRDLAAQTIGLCLIGKEKNAALVAANVARLLQLQRPNGHWSVKFDPNYAQTEMQTGESLYALSLAGLPSDHPAMLKGAAALLLNQKEFGGWFDVSPYEQFRTPFRETQWAVMALARLYPREGARRGWNDPLGPHPETLRTDSTSHLLDDLERVWGNATALPEGPLQTQIIALTADPRPLVRFGACRALDRISRSWPVKGAAIYKPLGDESKVVQRAAALALRTYGNALHSAGGRGPFQADHASALIQRLREKDDDRLRRGTARVFAAQFRDLSEETDLAYALIDRLDDPDVVVQMQAIKALWRWWYWRNDPALRNRIEDRLIAKLAESSHPWVRRNVVEALYIIGDENIRYLYNNWVPALATQERRDRATAAQHATVNRLAEKFVKALDSGSALQREGVLRALFDFPDRPGRIGNDLEPMLVYGETVAHLASALTRQMSDPDPTIRRLAVRALEAVRGDPDPTLGLAVLRMQADADVSVREAAGTAAKEFPLKVERGKADAAVLSKLEELLDGPSPDAQAAALAVLGRLGPVPGQDGLPNLVGDRLDHASPLVRASALRAVGSFPKLLDDPRVRKVVEKALTDPDPDARVAALALGLAPKSRLSESALRKALDDPSPAHRIALLGLLAEQGSAYEGDLRLIGVIAGALDDDNSGVREKTLQVIQAHPVLVGNPAVEEGLRSLARSSNRRQKEIATALLKSRGRSSGGANAADGLDIAYFEKKVLPIFNVSGEDGQSCIGCHRSHTILRLFPPAADGGWTPQAVRANFLASLRVVDLPNPSASLLLNKPTWEAAEEAEAQNDASKKAHAGGVRFEKGSRDYQALLDWINGARLKTR